MRRPCGGLADMINIKGGRERKRQRAPSPRSTACRNRQTPDHCRASPKHVQHTLHVGELAKLHEVARAVETNQVAHPGQDGDVGNGVLVAHHPLAAGQALVQHPLIKAVGFTGSLGGGRALFDLCAQRPEPIPFFGELGSVNPMFMLPKAIATRGEAIAKGWVGSLTMGAGQFCTNPGIVVLLKGSDADKYVETAKEALSAVGPQTMLTDGIAKAYRDGATRIAGTEGVRSVLTSTCDLRNATPYLFQTTAKDWLDNHVLGEEVFGPLGLIVIADSEDEMVALARSLSGQLTASIHVADGDEALGKRLMPILERKAGRVLANGFPTGVEVADSMVHGGPYPASTNFGATSVGTLSIRRFLRPVCYQDFPAGLLAPALQDGNPLGLWRLVDGKLGKD